VLFAECPEGTGSPALARWLAKPGRDRLETDARTDYDLNAQTAVSLATIAARTRVTWISPQSLPELVAWGITVTSDTEELVRRVRAAQAEGKTIVRLDHPTRCIPMS
jgi:hypothetical protein